MQMKKSYPLQNKFASHEEKLCISIGTQRNYHKCEEKKIINSYSELINHFKKLEMLKSTDIALS